MGQGKSLLEKIFGSSKKQKEEEKRRPAPQKNEFGEDEKTFDGVVRQLRSDLHKDTIVGPRRDKKK